MRATLPIWQDVPYLPRGPLSEEIACDAVVVGGGIAGVSSAWHLAERGLDVVLLEAAAVASGATGRSGGFLMAGAAPHYPETVRRWGRERDHQPAQASPFALAR